MAKSVLSGARFHNEEAAFAYVEGELWPTGPVCPHCENADSAKIGRLQGRTTRLGIDEVQRANPAIRGMVEKRLMYRDSYPVEE